MLVVDREVRDMISRGETVDAIRDYAVRNQNMGSLAQECIALMENGETTIQEVINTAYSYKGEGE